MNRHLKISPRILYFGTPVVLLSTENDDGTTNVAPISSAWALGNVVVLGLGKGGQSAHNLAARPDLVVNLLQMEARAADVRTDTGGDFFIVEAQVLAVHADAAIVVPGTDHIDPSAWQPLIYNFRHYFGLGSELGHSFRSETPAVHRGRG